MTRIVTAPEVADAVLRATGIRLVDKGSFAAPVLATRWRSLGPDDDARDALGDFVIAVYEDEEVARAEGFLACEDLDDRGIAWRHHPADHGNPREYWAAVTYHANLQLTWWTDEKKLGSGWERVDRILRELAAR